jgi:hypothetical protein
MRVRVWAAGAMLAVSAGTLAAQDAQCTGGQVESRDGCQLAVDLFKFVMPQLGTGFAGGNAVMGQGGVLGGLGHFSIGLRATVVSGDSPDLKTINTSITGIQPARDIPTNKGASYAGFTASGAGAGAEAALGLYKGYQMGFGRIGGIDALISATYMPSLKDNNSGVEIKPSSSALKLGFGARVGILEDHGLIPAVSFTYLKRDLPEIEVVGYEAGNDTINATGLTVKTTAWRLVASKGLLKVLTVAAGFGSDTYNSKADVRVRILDTGVDQTRSIALASDQTRTSLFLDAQVNLFLLKLIGEVGQVSGGSVKTYNTFSGKTPNDSYNYMAIGLRVGF